MRVGLGVTPYLASVDVTACNKTRDALSQDKVQTIDLHFQQLKCSQLSLNYEISSLLHGQSSGSSQSQIEFLT
jgi:hypothetical protein